MKIELINKNEMQRWWDTEIAIRRRARKDWNCDECNNQIKKSEEYVDDVFIINDYSFQKSYHHRICLRCWKFQ
jgi:hypothetical protein